MNAGSEQGWESAEMKRYVIECANEFLKNPNLSAHYKNKILEVLAYYKTDRITSIEALQSILDIMRQ